MCSKDGGSSTLSGVCIAPTSSSSCVWRPSSLFPPSPPSPASTPPSALPSSPLVKHSEEGAASATAGKCCQGAAVCPSFTAL